MKKLLLLLAMAVMVIGLVAGCGKSADNGGDKKSGTIGFSVSTLNNPFFVTMKEGVEAQAKTLGLKVKIVDAQNDPAKQVPVYSKHTRTSSTDKKNMISASTNKEHYPLPCRLKAVFRYRVFFHIYTAIHITARCFQHIHGFLLSPVYKKLQFRISSSGFI